MEKFIMLIRDNPALYDNGHPDYTNKEIRASIWKKICAECGFPNEKTAKTEWKRLRDTFRLTLNKPNGKKNGKNWKYRNLMNFLTPFMNHKDKTTEGSMSETKPEFSYFEHMLAPEVDEQFYVNDEYTYELPNKRFKTDEDKYMMSMSSIDHFFMSMCETTKNLPGNLQTQVKRKVFQAVIEAEEAFEQAKGFGFTQVSECNSSSNCEDWPTLYVSTEEQIPTESSPVNGKENTK